MESYKHDIIDHCIDKNIIESRAVFDNDAFAKMYDEAKAVFA